MMFLQNTCKISNSNNHKKIIHTMILSLCFISPILGSQFREIVFTSFWQSDLLNESSPTNYNEYISADTDIIENDIENWISYIDDIISEVQDSMQPIKDREARAISHGNMFIATLEESKTFIEKYIPYSIYPYINQNVLQERIKTFNDICNNLKSNNDYLVALADSGLDVDYPYEMELSNINSFLSSLKDELKKVLFYTFITLSSNAKEHRRIHGENNKNDIKNGCTVCNKNIKNDEYVFSFLCGHQAHLTCWKNRKINEDECLTCGKGFWDKIESITKVDID